MGALEEERRLRNNTIRIGHYVLPETPKGSACTPVGQMLFLDRAKTQCFQHALGLYCFGSGLAKMRVALNIFVFEVVKHVCCLGFWLGKT